MDGFRELIEVANILNSPEGCPWDVKQTFESLRTYVIEEAHEVVEAVDKGDQDELIEELGDLLYTIVFYAKVAEREKKFSMRDITSTVKQKLIRRHPHVFGDASKEIEEIIKNWERIKAEEKQERKSALDGIPKTLPSLLRAQKIMKRIAKNGVPSRKILPQDESENLALAVLEIVRKANQNEIDLDSAFRKLMQQEEEAFKEWELKKNT